jgi:hypothetical protein
MALYRKCFILPSLLLAFALGGCIKEDNAYCPTGLRLRYDYVLNTSYQSLLTSEIKSLRSYIFDKQTGVLVKIVDLTGEDIARRWKDVDLPEGEYVISSWGSSDAAEGFGREYLDGEMADVTDPESVGQIAVGSTTYQEFRMVLATDPVTRAAGEGEIAPINDGAVKSDLYAAFEMNATVEPNKMSTVDFEMIQNTEQLHVLVTGLEFLEGMQTRAGEEVTMPYVSLTANSELYQFNNSLDPRSRQVLYGTIDASMEDAEAQMDIRTQRFEIAHFEHSPALLHLKNGSTNNDLLLQPLNILDDVILKARNENGQLAFPDQESIDRVNEFTIEIRFNDRNPSGPLSVSVIVEGFEVINTGVDISRP